MERLIGYLLAVPGQDWPVEAHRTDAVASAIAGDRNRAMLVGAPDRHALLRKDVQYLLVRMAKRITGTGGDNPNLRLDLLHKGQ